LSRVQAWRLLGAVDLEAIAQGLKPLAQAWADDWLPGALLTLEVMDTHGPGPLPAAEGDQLLALHNEQGSLSAVVTYGRGLIGMLQSQALAALGVPAGCGGTPGGNDLLSALAHYQLRDLPARLARMPAGTAHREARYSKNCALLSAGVRGDGTVLVQMVLERHAVRIWLSHDVVAGWCRQPVAGGQAPLMGRKEALAARGLPFRLQAGVATLALADLLALQPGDVIRLDTGPESAMELVSGNGLRFGRAYLGLQDGQPAIQLCS
jgi:hypothetical protein